MAIHEPRARTRTRGRWGRRGTLHDRTLPPSSSVPPPPPPPDVRREISTLSGLNVVAGIWLIIAPWVLGYHYLDPKWNDVVFGAIIAILALVRAAGAYRAQWMSWINALIGVWLFVAAFTIDYSGVASGNDIVLGIVVFFLAIGSADATGSLFSGRRRDLPPV